MRIWRAFLVVCGVLAFALAACLFIQPVQNAVAAVFTARTGIPPQATWPYRFRQAQTLLLLASITALSLGLWLMPAWKNITKAIARRIENLDRWTARVFDGVIDLSPRPAQAGWPKMQAIDGVVLAVFGAYAAFLLVGAIQGNFPYIPLGGDAANTASFAAGLDHPELFHGDMLLEDPRNIQVYSTFNVAFMRWITPLTGTYSLSYILLAPIQVLLNLFGFYLFGRILLPGRFWALLLTALLSFTFSINVGEYWGVPPDPLSRFVFQAVLPYVLCMVLAWRDRPARWPWIMAATGLLFFLHPVSTPIWAVAIWLSLFGLTPPAWSGPKRLGVMILLGLVFVAAALPFVINYLANHVQGVSADYDLVLTVITRYFPADLTFIPAALGSFLPYVLRPALLPLALVGLVVLLFLPSCRRDLRPILFWITGILLTSILLPWAMHSLERALHRIPMETELVRGIRYFPPFMLLFVLWALAEVAVRLRRRAISRFAAATALAFTLGWGAHTLPARFELVNALNCLGQARVMCIPPNDYELAIQAVRELTPPGAPVYATFSNSSRLSYAMPVRFNALRPLVYSNKDRGLLVYSNTVALQRWYDTYQAVDAIQNNYLDNNVKIKRHLKLARELGARYLITELGFDPRLALLGGESMIYRNQNFALIRID
jgi:hypothetical protein